MNQSIQTHAHRSFVTLFVFIVAGCAAQAERNGDSVVSVANELSGCLPEIPAALAVPDGNKLAFQLRGVGVQIYDCKASADGTPAWVFRAPDADLLGPGGHIAGSHYAGPTWEALDGSTVVGTKLAGVTVDATAIPWLLLQGTGHAGAGRMSKVTYIQRLSTTGGLAPSGTCDIGTTANVDYTATYAFYAASHGHGAH